MDSIVIIGSMKGRIADIEQKKLYESYFIESLSDILEYAEKKDVDIVLEVLNRYETNYLNTIEQTNEFVAQMGSRRLKTHIDTFHMNIEEADVCESIEKCKNTLGHVHFADSNRRHPGAGHIDFRPILNSLEKIGYKGYIGIECYPFPTPDISAKKTIGFLSAI